MVKAKEKQSLKIKKGGQMPCVPNDILNDLLTYLMN